VQSDGRAVRSYLHGVDLTVWLLTMLLKGRPGRAYNVGSDRAIAIGDLAQTVASLVSPPLPVHLRDAPATGLPPRYVPSVERARRELGLEISIPLPDALGRTLAWARDLRRPPNLH
jgi:dTDP-glucose 4,6-dehydratase